MLKKVFINKIPFTIDCDMGTQDVGWLATTASYEYGAHSFPQSRYLPIMATNKEGEVLHPKLVICKYDKKIGTEIYVKVKNKESDPIDGQMTDEEKNWFNLAFGPERFFMDVKVRLIPSNDLKRDYNFKVFLNYKIHQPYEVFFPDYKDVVELELEEIGVKSKNELYQGIIKLPIGWVDYSKLYYKDKEGQEKETFDNKNKITIERYPEPLLFSEKEVLIRKKENFIKNKETSFRNNIITIEEEKLSEELRLKELENFLDSLPFSLDEIFEHTNKEIQDAQNDLTDIFSYLEKDEYRIFRRLFEIYSFYAKFYELDETHTDTVEIEALMAFYKNYFDLRKEELSTIVTDFRKFHISRLDVTTDYSFLDFVFSIIYLLYNIQIYKTISIETELNNILIIHEKRLQDDSFNAMFTDELVMNQIVSKIDFLKEFFHQYAQNKFENYHEMAPHDFIAFIKELSAKKNFDAITLIEKKFNNDICFYDFVEKLVFTADKAYPGQDIELFTKVSDLIEAMEGLFNGDTINSNK